MKVYRTRKGILLEDGGSHYLLENENWDQFINDDGLYDKLVDRIKTAKPLESAEKYLEEELLAPVQNQEIWASGVTYYNSKLGREEESKEAGGSNFYARVYEAKRPELFFKSMGYRAVGPNGKVRKRKDSSWDVPEPELTLSVTSSGKIVGYTIGNDMSSRSIEGENPLYLPQAKTYDGAAAVGPCILVQKEPLAGNTPIHMAINRAGKSVYTGSTSLEQLKRSLEELVHYLFLEYSFPHGCLLMTGTGIVPDSSFNLQSGDEIAISIDGIGTLINCVE
ncbi:fumarylacetoacetate hydrolase family protein [Poritiphilus flavus]|uniref:2-hydroxyhepta-2,4-diene-1,7-dioate isomerase n=1 Tax=Poritiphilus flavus TaxID=2697053 RepID=A0A6L9ECG4_9FLAO|nr:fumarylacetoacetate hydrolase family protein [Poritiphilus flavus]NAS12435.1 2-hydroxyhepta-2,4-diene-1,7-dioate isomerase [Poritiphilus flavus]